MFEEQRACIFPFLVKSCFLWEVRLKMSENSSITPNSDLLPVISENFEIIISPDYSSLLSRLKNFIYQHSAIYDRFLIFHFQKESDLVSSIFEKELISGLTIAQKAIISPFLISKQRKIQEKLINFHKSIPVTFFEFYEYHDRLIQFMGVPYSQASDFFQFIDLEDRPTCIVLINFDHFCRQTSDLVQLFDFIHYLSKDCGYLLLTQTHNIQTFYSWLAKFLYKKLDFNQNNIPSVPNQAIFQYYTIRDILEELQKEPSNYPDLINRAVQEWKSSIDFSRLMYATSIETKEYAILSIQKKQFLRSSWHHLRQLILALLIEYRLSLNENLLVVSDFFEKESWKEYEKEKFSDKITQIQLTPPKFCSIETLHQFSKHEFNDINTIILDFGDELTSDNISNYLKRFINNLHLSQSYFNALPCIVIQPFLLEEKGISLLHDKPSIPWRLATLTSIKGQQQELLILKALLACQKRTRKVDFYHQVNNFWFPQVVVSNNSKILQEDSSLIKILRLAGLMHHQHFQISPLGRFLLQQDILITYFLDYMKKEFPQLFDRTLTLPIPEDFFEKYYLTCSAWLIETLKAEGFKTAVWVEFQDVIFDTLGVDALSKDIQEDATSFIINYLNKYPQMSKSIPSHFNNLVGKKSKKLSKRNSPHWGKALLQVLSDILAWERRLKDQKVPIHHQPFFPVRYYARLAIKESTEITVSSYIRTIKRIFAHSLTKRTQTILKNKLIPKHKKLAIEEIKRLRKLLKIKYVYLKPNKASFILVFTHLEAAKCPSIHFQYLEYYCCDCKYFEKRRKKDCILIQQLLLSGEEIPPVCEDRIETIFSNMVACPFWRPKESVQIKINGLLPHYCYHCHKPLSALQVNDILTCSCETEYQLIFDSKTKAKTLKLQLTPNHTIGHDLALFSSKYYSPTDRLRRLSELDIPEKQRYIQTIDPPIHEIKTTSEYIFIRENDRLDYGVQNHLGVFKPTGKGKYYNLSSLSFIDTQKIEVNLLKKIGSFDRIKLNYRKHNLGLSPKDRANVELTQYRESFLSIKRFRKQSLEMYPLNQIASVYNVGKPRLNKILAHWGIEVIYSSSKGIKKKPDDFIPEVLELPGVRPILRTIHILGLLISVLRATSYVIHIAQEVSQEKLAMKLLLRTNWLLLNSPNRLMQYFQPNIYPLKAQAAFEAWMFRPFAEGIRSLVRTLNPELFPQDYGRTVARRIWKHPKHGIDFQGAYTPYDAALNTINRTLRYKLRLWNAKIGFGFDTYPIFSHISEDKPGRAGHLDLEEVGRLISRIILTEYSLSGDLHFDHFNIQFDDDNLIYYAPWHQITKQLRKKLVYQKILSFPIRYNHQNLNFADAHKKHVENLYNCLHTCDWLDDSTERISFLMKNYNPLIFSLDSLDHQAKGIFANFLTLINMFWIRKTNYLLFKRNPNMSFHQLLLINSDLINRLCTST